MIIEDNNRVPDILEALEKINSGYVEVGILGEEKELLMVANVQEYGVNIQVTDKMRNYLHAQGLHLKKSTKEIKVPERSYIRSSFDENKNKLTKIMEEYLVSVVELEMSADEFFNIIGDLAVSMIQDYMTDLKKPPLHPFTIERKGSSNPLIQSGDLRDKITYRVIYK